MGIYDLYQQYLAEAYAPKETIGSIDPYKYLLFPPSEDSGGDSTGGITTLSPQQKANQVSQWDFEAAANTYAKDQYGNMVNTGKVSGGLTEEEQLLMDKMTGKAPLTNMQKATLGLGFVVPGTGILTMANLYGQRQLEAKKAAEQMRALQVQQDIQRAIDTANQSGGTHSSDSSFTGHTAATGGGMGTSGWGGPR
jgi:hypothetical protein